MGLRRTTQARWRRRCRSSRPLPHGRVERWCRRPSSSTPSARHSSSSRVYQPCFAALLLGGVYCEAIGADGLDFGSIIDWTYLRTQSAAPARPNQFHRMIRLQQAPPLEAIHLMSPRSTNIGSLVTAMSSGRALLDAVPELSPEFLLKGATGLARRDWGAALSNLWIVVEQITSHLWESKILIPARGSQATPGRVDQLSDTRTWTVAARHELLHQTGTIGTDALGLLSVARRARNALSHIGKHPTESDARSAYSSALALLQLATASSAVPLALLDLADHTISDPFLPREPIELQPTHWMAIPKLPGEAELEKLEAAMLPNSTVQPTPTSGAPDAER